MVVRVSVSRLSEWAITTMTERVRERVELKDKVEEAWQMKSNFIRPASGVSCYPYLKRIMVLQRSVLPSHLSAQIHHVLDCFF